MSAPTDPFALLGVAVEPARAAAIAADQTALAERLRSHAISLAFEDEPSGFMRALSDEARR
jgi:hypothetical protein